MGGGLMQLVAYGAQDIYLTGNPQITFFKIVYRRYTNFSLESIEQTFNGSADWGKKVTCNISRNGDLINRVYLRVKLPDVVVPVISSAFTGFRWLNWIGHILVKTVEVEIGGQRIDKHYSEWLHIWNELTQTAGHALGYANMVGNTPNLTEPTVVDGTAASPAATTVKGDILYIPLQFWFCRNPGLALPLIALQYHEVKINLELNDVKNCYWAATKTNVSADWSVKMNAVTVPALASASLYVDYVYLDTDERRRFAQASHEYLIEQLQYTGDESTSNKNNKIKMNYNHPVKELIWVVQPDDNVADSAPLGRQWFNFTDAAVEDPAFGSVAAGAAGGSSATRQDWMTSGGENPVAFAKILLNGHDRFSDRDGRYFNLVQPFQHHENIPAKGINVYSFGLKPEEHQPSGTCNMSRIDNATLQLELTEASVKNGQNSRTCKVKIFAVNYNVLRIMSGMGGLSFAS